MKKIFKYDKYNFALYDTNTSIIYNDEKAKNKILNILPLDDYVFINSNVILFNISVKRYLELNEFEMKKIPYFDLTSILNKKISSLDLASIIYLKIVVSLVSNDGIVIFDDVLSYLDDDKKSSILNYLKENQITFINITSDTEDVLLTNYLIVLASSGVAIEGKTEVVLNEDKILRRLGFNLPFVFDLSLKLKSYGIFDRYYDNLDGLVNALWK